VWSVVVLFVSCRVVCSCCVFVCVTCFSSSQVHQQRRLSTSLIVVCVVCVFLCMYVCVRVRLLLLCLSVCCVLC